MQKKRGLIYLFFLTLAFGGLQAQVGIGTQTPRGAVDINSPTTNTWGLVLPTNEDANNIVNPQGGSVALGTVMYDSTLDCIRVYKSNGWSGCVMVDDSFDPSMLTVGHGSLSGRTCFDVALSNDGTNSCGTLSARAAQKADFTQPSINTQTYTFTPNTGAVSNVRFYYVNEVGSAVLSISGGNPGDNITSPVTATVSYNPDNNADALGLTNSNPLVSKIFVVYNSYNIYSDSSGEEDDRVVTLTVNIKDCACCGAMVSPTEWKEFLCHNLGADTTLDPNVPVAGLQGGYVQWGRRGPNYTLDSRVDWQTAANTNVFAAAPTAGNANAGAIPGWFTTPAPDNSWRTAGGTKTMSDPCPAGYRVPTNAEWIGVDANNTVSRTGTWTNGSTQYGSALHYGTDASSKLLTLPAAGSRSNSDGALGNRGDSGNYSCSTEDGSLARNFYFNSLSVNPSNQVNRTSAFNVRCIKE